MRRSTRGILAAVLVLALLGTGCLRWTTNQFAVTGRYPANVLVVIHRSPTNQLEGLHFVLNEGSPTRSLDMIGGYVWSAAARSRITQTGLAFSDFDYFFDRVQGADFQGAMRGIRNNTRCLALDRSWNPYTEDRHNWTTRNATDRHCLIGTGFPLA